MNQLISFLIISYNRPFDTIEAIENVFWLDDVAGFEKEIIVLNNGSTVDYNPVRQYLSQLPEEKYQLVRYIHHPQNLGVAGGRNFCIREARGVYLIFLDDDAEFTQRHAISLILDKYTRYKNYNLGIVGFLDKIPGTDKHMMPIKNLALIEGKNEIFYNLFYGYGHVFPKSLIEQTGYYQEDFFYGMEEYDLSYAAIKRGFSILFTRDIVVLHKVNPSGREPGIVTYQRMFHNKVIVAYKHLPMQYVISHFLLWSAFFLVKSKGKFWHYFRMLPSLRQRMQQAKREPMGAVGMQYLRKVKARLWY